MTILMCLTWAVLFILTAAAFWKGLIFYSQDDDVLKDLRQDNDSTLFYSTASTAV